IMRQSCECMTWTVLRSRRCAKRWGDHPVRSTCCEPGPTSTCANRWGRNLSFSAVTRECSALASLYLKKGDLLPDFARKSENELVHAALAQFQAVRPPDKRDAGHGSSSFSPLDARTSPPSPIPGYQMVREIHRGGQGVVYEARQESTGRTVAI